MYDALSEIGLDVDQIEWWDLALCRTNEIPTADFYEGYENSVSLAKSIDEACLSCPVLAQCLQRGIENSEWGVWGGIYLSSGKPDNNRNSHKSSDIWEEIRERVNDFLF